MRAAPGLSYLDPKRLQYLKEQLLLRVQSTAEWRRSKAEEYPSDERNGRSAQALMRLGERLRHVSPNHAVLQAISHFLKNDADVGGAASLNFAEQEGDLLSRYGFDWPEYGDPEEFFNELQNILADLTCAEAAE